MKSEDSTTRPSTPTAVADEDEWSEGATEGLLGSPKVESAWRWRELWPARTTALKVHAVVFAFYLLTICGFAIALGRAWGKLDRSDLYSPANEAVDWSVQEFNSGDGLHGDFVGEPRPALEKAWGDLLGPMNIRLSWQDVAAFGREKEAVALSDGSGYAGTLNAFHELHCIDEYWPGIDAEQKRKNKSHSNHCINALRKFAMCHGDVGLVIYSWQPGALKPGANGTAHTCVDWPRLHAWSRERSFDMFQPGLIVHP
ncbi:Uncharacterized protein TCAP_06185 [Tolypocladium capitatum]|uniref:Cyclochlorotine biosynthesis protein O n=1 Tax=Tolypocladium capitatum TaxID=45235 RepID=A0A2K3Q8T1_9HYPO|nr:Uncharacterized protein TCAP_06185 [Tolypocladium capitatum]